MRHVRLADLHLRHTVLLYGRKCKVGSFRCRWKEGTKQALLGSLRRGIDATVTFKASVSEDSCVALPQPATSVGDFFRGAIHFGRNEGLLFNRGGDGRHDLADCADDVRDCLDGREAGGGRLTSFVADVGLLCQFLDFAGNHREPFLAEPARTASMVAFRASIFVL
jgi:hypothetical protein